MDKRRALFGVIVCALFNLVSVYIAAGLLYKSFTLMPEWIAYFLYGNVALIISLVALYSVFVYYGDYTFYKKMDNEKKNSKEDNI